MSGRTLKRSTMASTVCLRRTSEFGGVVQFDDFSVDAGSHEAAGL